MTSLQLGSVLADVACFTGVLAFSHLDHWTAWPSFVTNLCFAVVATAAAALLARVVVDLVEGPPEGEGGGAGAGTLEEEGGWVLEDGLASQYGVTLPLFSKAQERFEASV